MPELIVHKLEGEFVTKNVVDILKFHNFDSIVVGPGTKTSLERVKTQEN